MKARAKLDDFQKLLKFPNKTGFKVSSREGASLELKESFNWGSKDEYAKTAAAFSNVKGGFFIFGITDIPRELVGLKSTNFENLDEAKITEYFNSVFSPEIDFEKGIRRVRGRTIGVLLIRSSNRKPVVAIKNDGKDVKEGEIYYRYTARSDKVKYPEMRALLEDVQIQERKYWKNMFERIAQIGSDNVAIMNVAEGTIEGKGGTLILDEKLIPKLKFIKEGSFKEGGHPTLKLVGQVTPVSVIASKKTQGGKAFQITTDPSAPLVRLGEEDMLKEFSLDFASLTAELKKTYKDFKANPKYHQIRKDLMGKNFSITRRLNPHKANGSKQDFYSPKIITEFGKYYQKR